MEGLSQRMRLAIRGLVPLKLEGDVVLQTTTPFPIRIGPLGQSLVKNEAGSDQPVEVFDDAWTYWKQSPDTQWRRVSG